MHQSYIDYLNSPEWQEKRQARLAIDKYRCRMCGATHNLQVHHIPSSYRLIPNESIEDDLTTLCTECHENTTDIIRKARNSVRVITKEEEEEALRRFREYQAKIDEANRRTIAKRELAISNINNFTGIPEEYRACITHTSLDIPFSVHDEEIITAGIVSKVIGPDCIQMISVKDEFGTMLFDTKKMNIFELDVLGMTFVFLGKMVRFKQKNSTPRIKLINSLPCIPGRKYFRPDEMDWITQTRKEIIDRTNKLMENN